MPPAFGALGFDPPSSLGGYSEDEGGGLPTFHVTPWGRHRHWNPQIGEHLRETDFSGGTQRYRVVPGDDDIPCEVAVPDHGTKESN